MRPLRTTPGHAPGPNRPLLYDFSVQQVAQALVLVGQGVSYTEAGRRCRIGHARQGKGNGKWLLGQMVANWVEVFTPIVAARWAVDEWPETVVIDSTPFYGNLPGGGTGKIFYVFVACGYDDNAARSQVVAIRPVTEENGTTWADFLRSKPVAPRLVISDKGKPPMRGIPMAWPNTTIRLCRWHLRKNLSAQPVTAGIDRNGADPVAIAAVSAFDDLYSWATFQLAVKRSGKAPLIKWMRAQSRYLRNEFRDVNLPRHFSNGTAETAVRAVRAAIGRRAFCDRNAARTALMLELVRLRLNRCDLRQGHQDLHRGRGSVDQATHHQRPDRRFQPTEVKMTAVTPLEQSEGSVIQRAPTYLGAQPLALNGQMDLS
jgi:hypothetical protein